MVRIRRPVADETPLSTSNGIQWLSCGRDVMNGQRRSPGHCSGHLSVSEPANWEKRSSHDLSKAVARSSHQPKRTVSRKTEADRNGREKIARRQSFQAIAPVADCITVPEARPTLDARLLAAFVRAIAAVVIAAPTEPPDTPEIANKRFVTSEASEPRVLFLRRVEQDNR